MWRMLFGLFQPHDLNRAGKNDWGCPDQIAGAGKWLPVSTYYLTSSCLIICANSFCAFPEAFLAINVYVAFILYPYFTSTIYLFT